MAHALSAQPTVLALFDGLKGSPRVHTSLKRRCSSYERYPREARACDLGDADRTLQLDHFLPLFTQLFPNAPTHRLVGVGHYCLEDAPDEIDVS